MFQYDDAKRKKNPREDAHWFSLITFFFARHAFGKSLRKELEDADVYEVLNNCEAKRLGDRLEAEWERAKRKNDADRLSLLKPLIRVFGREYMMIGLHQLVLKVGIMSIQPYLVGKFVGFFGQGQAETSVMAAYLYGGALVLSYVLRCVYSHNCMFYILQLGIKLRVATSSLLYRKTLQLYRCNRVQMSSGTISTLIAKDVFTFDAVLMFGHDLWIGVIQAIVMTYLMYVAIGVSALVGVAFMIGIVPFQLFVGRVIAKMRMECAAKTDERLRLIQEILTTIRIIKMYVLEQFYAEKTNAERKAEIKKLRLLYYLKGFILSLGMVCIRVSFYLSVLLYTYFEEESVTAEKIFLVLSCYAMLRSVITIGIPIGIAQMADSKASLNRIDSLLCLDGELPTSDDDDDRLTRAEDQPNEPSLQLIDVTIAIDGKTIADAVNASLARGLYALSGPLGCGKSTLIGAILRDRPIRSGAIHLNGTVSYASQEPWLFPGSIRQNILFGEPYDVARYQRVLTVCALRSDIDRLPHADRTVLIDRGLNLSRGQQARVNLARAIYKQADVYLLDDALSSLDTNVGRFVFDNCVKEFLADKVRVLVTHQRTHMQEVDGILYLQDGRLSAYDDYDGLARERGDELLSNRIDHDEGTMGVACEEATEASDFDEGAELLGPRNVYREEKPVGRVDPRMYDVYLSSGSGVAYKIFLVVVFVLATIFAVFFDYYVKRWVNMEERKRDLMSNGTTNTAEYAQITLELDLVPYIYTALIVSAVVFSLLQSFSFFYFTSCASIALHKRIFEPLLKAKMAFFDTHPAGNILNRFSKDMSVIDEYMPFIYYEVVRILLILLGIVILIISTSLLFLLYSVVLGVVLYVMRVYYLPASRSLKRLELSTRAPMLGHLNASLDGLTTIRACKAESLLVHEFDRHQDLNSSATYMYVASSRAFGFYLDLVCVFYVIAIVLTFLLSYPNVSAGNVGLALTQSLGLAGLLQWGVRQSAEVENCMTSVERVCEYMAVEGEAATSGDAPSATDRLGSIEFRDVSLRYATSETVLNGLSFAIAPGERVAVIGRTGAGKSSLVSVLFRLYDIDDGGEIAIDSVDIKRYDLRALRDGLTIMPQEPYLFDDTIRNNLDPHRRYDDRDLWRALDMLDMKAGIGDLGARIGENGVNFSIGERQLICLARALLKRSRILILDEATANMDPAMDAKVQKMLRNVFTDCTIVTIAHRLDTILDYDKIMVLDGGELIEFDRPDALLGNEGSRFYRIMKQARLI